MLGCFASTKTRYGGVGHHTWRLSMKLTAAFGVIFMWTNFAWAQSTEIDRLNRVVEEQGQQIEELKQRLAQMERFLVNIAAVNQPAIPTARVIPVSTAVVTSA